MEITLTTTNLPREVVVHKNLDEFLKKMAMNKIKVMMIVLPLYNYDKTYFVSSAIHSGPKICGKVQFGEIMGCMSCPCIKRVKMIFQLFISQTRKSRAR